MKLKITVPATSANIGPGFDIWGMALQYYNEFICEVKPAGDSHESGKKHSWKVTFNELVEKTSTPELRDALVNDPNNLVIQSYESIMEKKQKDAPQVCIEAKIGIPISRGLGSSSTAILAGMVLANEVLRKYYEDAFTMNELFNFACKKEGHPDNIAPALFGGWVLSLFDEKEDAYFALDMPLNAPLRLAGIVPHISLSTHEARKAISKTQPLEVCAFQSSRTAVLGHLMSKEVWEYEDIRLFRMALEDKIHQNARASLIPGLLETFEAWKEKGALGAYLSGAGTTILGFWPADFDVEKVNLKETFVTHGSGASVIYPEMDRVGLKITHL